MDRIPSFEKHGRINGQNFEADEIIQQTTDPDLSWTWSFILTALQIPHHILIKDGAFHLLVSENLRTKALKEIEDYLSENYDCAQRLSHPEQRDGQTPTLLLMGSLVIFYVVTGPWDGNSIWFKSGTGNSQEILQHFQWYRLITSQTLHADIIHLLNNCILGGLLLHFFFLLVGSGIGFFTLLITATAGNYINVVLHGEGHIFIGFSTAIFAVIGMLSMLKYSEDQRFFGSRVFSPLMAGAALLAMLGSSGERTDLGAHFFGLLCGLLTGKMLCFPLIKKLKDSIFIQVLLFLFTLFIILISWALALKI